MDRDSLDHALTPTRGPGGAFEWDVPVGWEQGRGAFGGLVLGALVRALELGIDERRVLRSLSAEIVAPVLAGPAAIAVTPLREGSAVSCVRAELTQHGEVAAHAVAVFAAARPGTPRWSRVPTPDLVPWRSIAPLDMTAPGVPVFARHFEYRLVHGAPFSGGTPAETRGWVRPGRPASRRDSAWLVALADAWWTGATAASMGPRPIATIAFTFERVGELDGLDPEAPLFQSTVAPVAVDGYTMEYRGLWGADGRLVGLNHQVVAFIR